MIYLNNAATTIIKPETTRHAAEATVKETQQRLAKLFGMKYPEDIVLTEGGSQAIEAVVRSFVKSGDHILSTDMEYGFVTELLETLEEENITVDRVPVNCYGTLSYDKMQELITDKTKAIIVTHGSTVTGNVADLEKISAIAHRCNLMVIADGAQTVGAIDVKPEDLGVDAYCFTGHKKLMGPYGTGGICLKHGVTLDADVCRGLVKTPEPEKLGRLCAALDFIDEKGIYGITIFPHRLAKRFFEAVKSMKQVEVYGDFGTSVRIPTVSVRFKGADCATVKEYLQKQGIVVNGGLQHSPREHEALGTSETGLVRFSFGYFNTRQEVNAAILAIMDLLGLDDLYLLS